jgi:hypothetical protein
MYLQLAGLEPLDTAENPLAPGAPTYKYKDFYLGQGQDIILPDALFPANVEGYAKALKDLEGLYNKYAAGIKKKITNKGMSDPISFAVIMGTLQAIGAGFQALSTVARSAQINLARQRITELYNNNTFNVQNLNRLTPTQLSNAMTQIDEQINMTPRAQFGRQMALARFRLVYQQRFDQVAGGGGIGNLPGWVLPAALGLGAFLLLRGRK